MSILTHHTTRKEAAQIARALKVARFDTNAAACYGYVANIAKNHGGADAPAVREAQSVIDRTLETY